MSAAPDPVQARKDFVARQPMGRLGSVEDIAPLLVYLASDESSFATGAAFTVDGGMTT
jgi:NAD(P)-dependent dehydrogenase (short-subunit alcohol dehydrogenase family)